MPSFHQHCSYESCINAARTRREQEHAKQLGPTPPPSTPGDVCLRRLGGGDRRPLSVPHRPKVSLRCIIRRCYPSSTRYVEPPRCSIFNEIVTPIFPLLAFASRHVRHRSAVADHGLRSSASTPCSPSFSTCNRMRTPHHLRITWAPAWRHGESTPHQLIAVKWSGHRSGRRTS